MSVFIPDAALFAFAELDGELLANPAWRSVASSRVAGVTGGGHG